MSKHTIDSVREEALKYTRKCDFKTKAGNVYYAAIRMGVLKDITSHMSSKSTMWTYEMLLEEALKYSSRSEFTYNNKSAYEAARKRCILDNICKHMDYLSRSWTIEELKREAAKYAYRSEFKKYSYNAYRYAYTYGKLEEITAHMSYKLGGFDKKRPATLYFFKIGDYWKVGITNRTVKERYQCDYLKIRELITVYFDNGADAYKAEQKIIKEFERYRYSGPTIFTDGTSTTECFVLNVSRLSEVFDGR